MKRTCVSRRAKRRYLFSSLFFLKQRRKKRDKATSFFSRLCRPNQASPSLSRTDDVLYRNRGLARNGSERRSRSSRSDYCCCEWRQWTSSSRRSRGRCRHAGLEGPRRVSLLGASREDRRNSAPGRSQGEFRWRRGVRAGARRDEESRHLFFSNPATPPKKKQKSLGPSPPLFAPSRPWPPSRSRRIRDSTWSSKITLLPRLPRVVSWRPCGEIGELFRSSLFLHRRPEEMPEPTTAPQSASKPAPQTTLSARSASMSAPTSTRASSGGAG